MYICVRRSIPGPIQRVVSPPPTWDPYPHLGMKNGLCGKHALLETGETFSGAKQFDGTRANTSSCAPAIEKQDEMRAVPAQILLRYGPKFGLELQGPPRRARQ